MSRIERTIAKQAAREGHALPERIANAPQLDLGLEFILNAFFDLDSERSHSMGPQRIPWSSIKLYADEYKLDQEERDDLFFFINAIDAEHVANVARKQETK